MRIVLTRVNHASVKIDGEIRGEIHKGYMALLGIYKDDTEAEAIKITDKIEKMRIFEDENGKMNLNIFDAGFNEILVISQFTLFADCKSRRPGFSKAASPDIAIPLYNFVINSLKSKGFIVATGEFGADMKVLSENDGPITIILDTNDL